MQPAQDEPGHPHLAELRESIERGGAPKYHEANAAQGQAVRA